MRRKLRDPVGGVIYGRRKAIVEPVNGVLKESGGCGGSAARAGKSCGGVGADNHRV